jgi:GH43 family beta-xylosidase
MPYIIPSPDGEEYFLVYSAAETGNVRTDIRQVYMQKIEIGKDGVPDLGEPRARTARLSKPSGLRKRTNG